MMPFIAMRTMRAGITMAIVSFIMFMLLFVGPNPLNQLRRDPSYTPADIARLTHQYGWDKPWYQQYSSWAGGFVTGDWGESIRTRESARSMIAERLPLTLALTGLAQLLSLVIAIPLGVWLAARRGSKTDHAAALMCFAFMAAPAFLIAFLLQVAAVKMFHATGQTIFYTAGLPMQGSLLEYVRHLTLPVLSLSLVQIASWSRYQRSELLLVMQQEYLRTAKAKGLPERVVMSRHALRNTLVPIITIVAIDVAALFGGAIFTEAVFNLPGMGSLLLSSVQARDVVVALDIVVIGTALMVLANMAADVLYGAFDPRVRAG